MGIIASGLYLALIGMSFHYYINTQLKSLLINTGIVFALDTFGLRPFTLFIMALITRKNR